MIRFIQWWGFLGWINGLRMKRTLKRLDLIREEDKRREDEERFIKFKDTSIKRTLSLLDDISKLMRGE